MLTTYILPGFPEKSRGFLRLWEKIVCLPKYKFYILIFLYLLYSTSSLFRHIFPFSRPFSIPKLSRPLIFARPREIYTASPQKSIFVILLLKPIERPFGFRRPASHGRSPAIGTGIPRRVGQRVQGPRGSWQSPETESLVHPREPWSLP